jgi:hypothetical protein
MKKKNSILIADDEGIDTVKVKEVDAGELS